MRQGLLIRSKGMADSDGKRLYGKNSVAAVDSGAGKG